jgi:drug/metabolite transporter (DMT)-like permease
MRTRDRDTLINWGLLLLLGVVWGFSFFFMKRGLVAFDPYQVAAIRIFFAFISFIPLIIFIGFKVPKKRIPMTMLSAILGSGIPPFLFTIAQTRIDSSVAGILNSLTPLFALAAGVVIFRLVMRWNHVVGVLIGLGGTVLIVLIRSDGGFEFNFGHAILVVLATLFYGINANIIKSKLYDVHPIQIALVAFSFLGPFAGAYLFSTDFVEVVRTNEYAWHSLGYMALLSVFGTSYALILFNILAHRTSALFSTMVTYIIPLVAVFIGFLDGEKLGPVHVIGMILILSGVYISSIRKRKMEKEIVPTVRPVG